jgi:hypothetical protein
MESSFNNTIYFKHCLYGGPGPNIFTVFMIPKYNSWYKHNNVPKPKYFAIHMAPHKNQLIGF